MTSELDKLCAVKRVRIEAQYGGVEVPAGWQPGTHPYKVTLHYRGRRLTVPFFMGPANTREPTAADVLYCLVSDASSYENATGFEDFCRDFGYDTDSRKAERIYRQLERQAPKVRRLLGEDFETFAQAEH